MKCDHRVKGDGKIGKRNEGGKKDNFDELFHIFEQKPSLKKF